MEENNSQEKESSEPSVEALPDTNLIEKLKADVDAAKKDYLYLHAEFDNYRKHAEKDRIDFKKYASKDLVTEMLGVLDNFNLALGSSSSIGNIEAFKKGMDLIYSQLKSTLEKFGVTEIPSEGKMFDPSIHEALGTEPSSAEPGTITRVFRKAYKLHDRVIRHAQVMIAAEAADKKENE